MIYRQGPITRYVQGEYAEQSSLFTFDPESWIAGIGLAWDFRSWHVITVLGEVEVPGALTGPFANLPSLEVALRRYLRQRDFELADVW